MEKQNRVNRNIRFTDAEWLDFRELLGAEWLRAQIARAREKADKRKTAQPPK